MADSIRLAEGTSIRIMERYGQGILRVERQGVVVASMVNPEELDQLGQALLRSAMIVREQRVAMSQLADRCPKTYSPGYWPFEHQCTLRLKDHTGRKCIDRFGRTFDPK